jgi:hypothetical protein
MERSKVIDTAVSFFSSKGYLMQTQTTNVLVFQTEKRELNWIIVLVLCCLGIIPSVIYYYVFAPKHQVTISMGGEGNDVRVTASGNTNQAKKDASEFATLVI